MIGQHLSINHTPEQVESDVVPFNAEVRKKGEHRGEVGHRRKNGTAFPTLMGTTILKDDNGKPVGLVGIARDITERKQADAVLSRQTEELLRSNAELEQFAYVASHDLQEPLRMVASYVQLLARRYQGKLDADADEFIGYAVDGANRMQGLIADLLAYSRVARQGMPFEMTPCEAVLATALANLKITIAESGAVITHDPLPAVLGSESQLVQLFQNLIANALKFHGAEPPRIHVSANRVMNNDGRRTEPTPGAPDVSPATPSPEPPPLTPSLSSSEGGGARRKGEGEVRFEDAGRAQGSGSAHLSPGKSFWLFSVRDHGIGIDPQHFERIFRIFQRLHNRTGYAGSGLGLAIARKIVERHGGAIRVDSQPGQGSTFSFTLPA
jgi:signal transduction histidine kinase